MFGDLKDEWEQWKKYYDLFEEKFGEEVGIAPAVFESDEYELDLTIGQDSEQVIGARIYVLPSEKKNSKGEKQPIFVYDLIKTQEENKELPAGELFVELPYKNPMLDEPNTGKMEFYADKEGAIVLVKQYDDKKEKLMGVFVPNKEFEEALDQ